VHIDNRVTSITIGSFDGIHLAHQALISQAQMLVAIERGHGYLTAGYRRSLYTDKPITLYHLEKIRTLTPEAFVAKLTKDFPRLEKIVIGYDFHFGKEKSGNATLLQKLFQGEVCIVDEITHNGIPVHSRTIRAHLQEGDIATANALLGRTYHISGKIIPGQGLGTKSLVPTLNIRTTDYQLPLAGVYATRTLVAQRWLPSVSFIGHRVSTDGAFAVETHIIGEDIGLQQGEISIAFEARLRPNRKFDGLPVLRQQIDQDIKKAREISR